MNVNGPIGVRALGLLWIAIASCGGTVNAQSPEPSTKLVAAIDRVIKRHGFTDTEPGVAVLIHQPGEMLFQKGYGLANLATKQPITSQTMFELASVSKTFTATAILILHDRGKLSIDHDVLKYLPELPNYQRGFSEDRPIQIRDLLQHTSGLPDYMDFENVPKSHKTYWVNADYLPLFARDKKPFPLEFPTGSKYRYNNTNFMLLASIIERVSKRSFGTFLKEEIFTPVGMKHSFVYEDPKTLPRNPPEYVNAVGYEWRKRKEIWEPTWGTPPDRHEELLSVGDGAVWTNLEDMAQWDLVVRDERLLKPETWKLALTPSRTSNGKANGYGLGWSVYFNNPDTLNGYGHDGSWGGFKTTYYRYLTAERTTVLLSNRGNLDTDKLWLALDLAVADQLH